jgi:hypothetical protein
VLDGFDTAVSDLNDRTYSRLRENCGYFLRGHIFAERRGSNATERSEGTKERSSFAVAFAAVC